MVRQNKKNTHLLFNTAKVPSISGLHISLILLYNDGQETNAIFPLDPTDFTAMLARSFIVLVSYQN